MSISDRLKSKQKAIMEQLVAPAEPSAKQAVVAPRSANGGPLTAPGGMALFRGEMLKQEATVAELEKELAQFREGVRTVRLSTDLISPSRWANRHEKSLSGKAFEELKEEIAASNGNIQPILVRPVGKRYEVVFGHRRYAACVALGLDVLAMVMELTDLELFTMMDRENRHREDLSPFEQGEMWRKALDEGLYPSSRQMASALGVSHTHVGRCVAVARMPALVLEAFSNPTEIQVRWALELQPVLQTDPEGLAERARQVVELQTKLPAKKIFEMLLGRGAKDSKKTATVQLKAGGRTVGQISRGDAGEVSISISAGQLDDGAFTELQATLQALLAK